MTIKTLNKDDIVIMQLSGKLDSNTSAEANARFKEILKQGRKHILMDFWGLDYISSAGIRVLLILTKQLRGQGKLGFYNMNEQVREVFEMTGLAGKVFKIYSNEQEALKAI